MTIPVYIINRDWLSCTKRLVDWLLDAGTERIVIVDNASTYPPLLEYYEALPKGVELYQVGCNKGPLVFWERELHLAQDTPYVLTDSDVVPADCCPKNLIEKLEEILNTHGECPKVGPGLRIDNIPDSLPFKDRVLKEN